MDLLETLAKNNDASSDATIKEVNDILRKPLQDLQDLDAEIQGLEQCLEELKTKRKEVQQLIEPYQSILSPIRRLPTDVLGEIFCRCLPTSRNPIMKTNECPLLLTHICSRWRAVAIADSRLWSRLHITFSDDDLIPVFGVGRTDRDPWTFKLTNGPKKRAVHILRTRIDAVKEWISRSGSRPLSISLNFTCNIRPEIHSRHSPTDDMTLELLQFLAFISPRLEDLELNMPFIIYCFLEDMVALPQIKLLQSFRADYRAINILPRQSDTVGFFVSPNLQKISISGWHLPAFSERPSRNWSKLTHMVYHIALSVSDIVYFLKASPNLIFFKTRIAGNGEDVASIQPNSISNEIFLPHLSTLDISEEMSATNTNALYAAINAPSLACLAFRCWFTMHRGVMQGPEPRPLPIAPLLCKSGALKKLKLNADHIPDFEVDSIFRAVPMLTHLIIGRVPQEPSSQSEWTRDAPTHGGHYISATSFWNIGSLLIDHCSDLKTNPPLLPNLESSDVSISNGYFSDELLTDFIVSRLNPSSPQGITPLKHVGVQFFRYQEMDAEKEIRRHAELVGLDIDLQLHYPDDHQNGQSRVFSPGYGLQNGRSWHHDDFQNSDLFSY